MEYLLYNFTGISKPDGETKSVQLETVIRKYDKMFTSVAATTDELLTSKGFCLEADYYSMESIISCIEDGYVIVPFSKRFYIVDLLKYYNLGMKVLFMKVKDYKQFKEDYGNSLVTVEDKRTKGLF